MVLVRDIHVDILCLHVRLREFHKLYRSVPDDHNFLSQAQLVPQLIINYKLKVRHMCHSYAQELIGCGFSRAWLTCR